MSVTVLIQLRFASAIKPRHEPVDEVQLGHDRVFYNADSGDCGKSRWGVNWPVYYGSHYYISTRKATAAVHVGAGDGGGAEAWAWVGKSFLVTGSGSQTAVIWMQGYYKGYLVTAGLGAGYALVEIDLVIKDLTSGADWEKDIYHKRRTTIPALYPEASFEKNQQLTLIAEHAYLVYVKVYCCCEYVGLGGADSWFGPEAGGTDQRVEYYSITIDFQ